MLTLIAEASATFVGFSLAIGLLQPDQPNAASRHNSMRGVAELAIIAGAGAFLALLLNAFDLPSATVWRLASAALAMGWAVSALFASRRIRKAGSRVTRSPTLLVVPFLVSSGILLLAWNTIAPDASSGARYNAALVFALSASASLFLLSAFEHLETPPGA